MKYAAKAEQKTVPAGYENVGRFWGIHGHRATVAAATRIQTRGHGGEEGVELLRKLDFFAQRLVSEGKAKVLFRSEDVFCYLIMDNWGTIRAMRWVADHHIARMYAAWLFQDAELTDG